uniref:CRAL/TRIO N-terminal domain-containing protein n=1 Tax=Amazona collaria TaxID=241587 RepID=A0A8B9F5B6_9PSIT
VLAWYGDLRPAALPLQFRENLQDVLPSLPAQDDHFLLKWLRARSFDVPKSEAMLRKVRGPPPCCHQAPGCHWDCPILTPARGVHRIPCDGGSPHPLISAPPAAP